MMANVEPDGLWDLPPIAELDGVDAGRFFDEILPASKPVILRGLVSQWPAVSLAARSVADFAGYLKGFDTGLSVDVMEAPSDIGGHFFYAEDMHRFNFVKRKRPISETLDDIVASGDSDAPGAIYMGSIPIRRHLPTFAQRNPAPFALPVVAPRIWIGGAYRVQTHFDPLHNLACCVAGRRRFIVFPPEQLANLYLGPMELTPAGAVISLARLEDPDFDRFPRLKTALEAATMAVLEPGDALFLPHYWFHHVTTTDAFNVQVNYWWGYTRTGLDNPRNSFLAALMGIKGLEGDEKVFWKTMFDHYVFQVNGDPVDYIPEDLQSALGRMTPQTRERIRAFALALLNEKDPT